VKITLRASPFGGGVVLLSWKIEPEQTATIMQAGKPVQTAKAGFFSELLLDQPLGKTNYQLKDDATGTVSNKVYTTVS